MSRTLHVVNAEQDLTDALPAVSDADVHDVITSARAKGKAPTVYDVERWDKGQEQQHWQTVESENAAFRSVCLFWIADPLLRVDTWRVYAIKKPLQIHGSTSMHRNRSRLNLMTRF